jgi:Flp pilus assembly protein TadG
MNATLPSKINRMYHGRSCRRAFGNTGGLSRRGIAAVEFAVVFPILLLLVLGTVEVCQRLFLRQSATIAAYEGIRVAARKTSAASDVTERCNSILTDRRIKGATVTVTPSDFKNLASGTAIKLEINVPWDGNSVTRFVLKDHGTVSVTATMLRE